MVATSPTFLPTSPCPIGEVVEINPLVTSDSSLVTSRYTISASLVESNTTTVEPNPALSRGMLVRFTSDSSAMRFFNWPSRAFTKTCRCLAMWYSAFSERSPRATAFLISAGSSWLSSCSRTAISSRSFFLMCSGIHIPLRGAGMLHPREIDKLDSSLYAGEGRDQGSGIRDQQTAHQRSSPPQRKKGLCRRSRQTSRSILIWNQHPQQAGRR